jgi:hypothetical protein
VVPHLPNGNAFPQIRCQSPRLQVDTRPQTPPAARPRSRSQGRKAQAPRSFRS